MMKFEDEVNRIGGNLKENLEFYNELRMRTMQEIPELLEEIEYRHSIIKNIDRILERHKDVLCSTYELDI